jgi:FixJ family two-component response regulator
MNQNETHDRPLVSVVEDDVDMNRAVCGLAAAHGWDAESYGDAGQFLERYDGSRTGCIVLDLRLPDASGLQVIERLADREDHIAPVIFVTGHGDLNTAVTAMKSELVQDFVEKPFVPADLLRIMESAIARDREIMESWRVWWSTRERLERLSERERQVLDALMEGKSNKQIALELDVSHKTVSTHRTHVLEKFSSQSIVDVARMLEAPQPRSGATPALAGHSAAGDGEGGGG